MIELAELRIDIDVWDEFDTKAFIELALAEAGRAALTFTDDAIEALHRLAGGVPRRVKQLAELALLAGAGSQVALIDLDTIEGVYRELGVVTAGSFS
jgi:type II secretory pathway predicted ATPase ExeA